MLHPDDLLGDLETRSRTDLKAAGARRYAADPSTRITTASWIFRGVRKNLSTIHPQLGSHTLADLYADARACRRFVFHNANFDVNVLRGQNPFFQIELSKIDCTMGRAQSIAMPGGLDDLCHALGVKGKDPRGRALVMATCKPMRNGEFNEDYNTHRELLEYNDEDREALLRVDELLPPLSADERKVFERTWRKNELGLPIDVHLATAIALRRQEIEVESQQELRELTQNAVTKVTQRKRIIDWANGGNRAANLPGTKKHEVAEALTDENLHPDVRRVLEILQQDGGSAPTKAQALLDRHVGGWYKDGTRFFGARSGRGTSEGANMFNIARPSGKYDIEEVIAGLKAGFVKYNNTALTDCLRGCIVAPDGYLIADNDESNAELRIALWQAGDTERLNILASGQDLYMYNGIKLFNLPQDASKSTHPKERQTAKNVTLGGNYQLGWRTYMAFLIKTAAENGLKREDITELKAQNDIMGYRRANPLLQQLWFDLADAFKQCIYDHPGRIFTAGKIAFQKDAHGTIWMLLPSGRAIPHYGAHISYDGEMAFYRAKFGMMLRQKAFGGSLLEISCFAGDTEVLTRTGFKRIDAVTAQDMVWDGAEWVTQKGSVCLGAKSVVEVCGTRVTPDHLILCSETELTQTWQSAGDLSQNELRSATGLATSLLPDGCRAAKVAGSVLTSWLSAIAAPLKKSSAGAIFATSSFLVALFALGSRLQGFGKRAVGGIWCRTISSVLNCSAPSAAPSVGVQTHRIGILQVTAVAASKCTRAGLRIAALISNTSSRFRGGMIPALNLTGSITMDITNPAICNSVPANNKHSTGGKFKISKQYASVYDLLDCGPKNRFTIRTGDGRFLLVHNCQSMTRDIITASEADIENELPDVHLILDVYDSILALVPKDIAEERSEQIRQIMSRPRPWTSGLPLGCEGYTHTRMKK